ncbi:MAG: putative molybdenum carrier protein [Gemmatimonadota bacterium]|nr:putative molybdenum carrier protein [Gemmatimonadota bacterium]
MPSLIREIQSGGQTGVDRAALDAAMAHGIPYGGWIPRGRLAEDGVVPDRYIYMVETVETDYAARTERNVQTADATLVIHFGPLEGGSLLTAELAARFNKPCLTIDLDTEQQDQALQATRAWLTALAAQVRLNVAGPRASVAPDGYGRARAFLEALLGEVVP